MADFGTQISDMIANGTIPDGSFVPFIVTAPIAGLSPQRNYRYDIGTEINGLEAAVVDINAQIGALPANAVALAALKALSILHRTAFYDAAIFNWTLGDYSGQADDVNIVKADSTDLSVGAWVRQQGASISFKQDLPDAAYLDITSKLRAGEVSITDGFGVTDPTGAANSNAAINLAIAALADAGGGTLTIPRGLFKATSINLNVGTGEPGNRVAIRGQGPTRSIIQKFGTDAAPLVSMVADSTGDPAEGFTDISDLSLLGHAGFGKAANGIEMYRNSRIVMNNVLLRYFNEALRFEGSLSCDLYSMNCQDNNIGLHALPTSTDLILYPNSLNIFGGSYSNNTSWGIDLDGAAGFMMQGGRVEGNGTAGDLNTGGIRMVEMGAEIDVATASIGGVWMERNKGRGIYIPAQSDIFGLELRSIRIINQEQIAGVRHCVDASLDSLWVVNCESFSPNDTWTVACTMQSKIEMCRIANIVDTTVAARQQQMGNRTSDYQNGGFQGQLTVGRSADLAFISNDGSVTHRIGFDDGESGKMALMPAASGVILGGTWDSYRTFFGGTQVWNASDNKMRQVVGAAASDSDGEKIGSQ